MPKMLKN